MSDDTEYAYVPEFKLVRRPKPPPPPPFQCVACKKTIRQDDPWTYRYTEKPPICNACVRRWMTFTGIVPNRASRGDYAVMQRLSAVIECLEWEIHNGDGRWRKKQRFHAAGF